MTWATDPERHALGQERLERFIEAQARLSAEAMTLTMSVGFAGQAGYSDEALAAIDTDARDLLTAAHTLADHTRQLAREWRKQRIAAERGGE